MPMTVITVSNAPASLRGDLTKWMQEIATGVYVGNFNARIREELWERVTQSIGSGEATLSYASRNEIGYNIEVYNTDREIIDYDGIPLVMIPSTGANAGANKSNYSKASNFHKARKYTAVKPSKALELPTYVVIDIETDGLRPRENKILEIAAIKVETDKCTTFESLVKIGKDVPENITELTGITSIMLEESGRDLGGVLTDFLEFIGDYPIVGYNVGFDISFINSTLKKEDLGKVKNKSYDLMRLVKRDKKFLKDYKLETVLVSYGIEDNVLHRAVDDAKLICMLSTKVNGFSDVLSQK